MSTTNNTKFIAKNGLQAQNISLVDSISNESHRINLSVDATDKLSFDGDVGQLFSLTDSNTGTVFSVNAPDAVPLIEADSDYTLRLVEFGGNIGIGKSNPTAKLDVQGDLAVNTNVLYVNESTSNVGIGTTSPNYNLHLNQNSEGGPYIRFTNSATNSGTRIGLNAQQLLIDNKETSDIIMRTSSTERLKINQSGLDVTGNISLNDKLVHNGNTNTSVRFPTNDTVTIETSGAEAFRVDSTGRVGIGTSSPSVTLDVNGDFSATTITETSSIQLKSHIEPITNAISTIESLFGVNYIRKSSGKREVGLIAEDVELILPEIVDTRGEYKSISYGRLTAYLIEAIKSLKTELDEIKKNNGQS